MSMAEGRTVIVLSAADAFGKRKPMVALWVLDSNVG
jgi:hypothetical protein